MWKRSLRIPRYHVPPMQGEARMCQEVGDFFNTVHPNERGIRIGGLYGMSGLGKTTLVKAFSYHNLGNYNGKVVYIEFCGGNGSDTQNLVLQYLTRSCNSQFEWVTGEDDVRNVFCSIVAGQRVLLVLDNITEASIDKVSEYLGADVGDGSSILLIAQTVDVLLQNFNIDSKSCMHIPRLRAEEAIGIMLEKTSVEYGARGFALKCAKSCSFKEDTASAPTFHPLALKALGRHCFSKHHLDLSNWVAEIDGLPHRVLDDYDDDDDDVRSMAMEDNDGDDVRSVAMEDNDDHDVRSMAFHVLFDVLGMAFNEMDPKSRSIFMLLTLLIPPMLSSHEVIKGLAENCKEEVS
ncbi:hypothetical protein SUGI_0868860 [Cryptomeria japonica]|nr:hypothetical protein SUGI_0868860 [Cryptomeria japonica]